MKRVLIIRNYLLDDQPSMRLYVDSLERELRAKGWSIVSLKPWVVFARLSFGLDFLEKWLGYLDKFILLTIRLWIVARSYELVHIADHSYSWLSYFSLKNNHLVTCHDLLAIRSALGEFKNIHKTRWSGRILQKMIIQGLKHARAIVCVSENTRQDLYRLIPVSKNRTWVIYNGVNRDFRKYSLEEARKVIETKLPLELVNGKKSFFFHVGIDSWYKNRRSLIAAFIELSENHDCHLVLARGPMSAEEKRLIQKGNIFDRIHFIGRVSDEEIQALYSLAQAFVFPSWIEGFGWPIIEAQICGCPVIISDREPLKTIAGKSAIWIDPLFVDSIADGMKKSLFESSEEREERVQRGFENCLYYSQERMIGQYHQLYHRMMPR